MCNSLKLKIKFVRVKHYLQISAIKTFGELEIFSKLFGGKKDTVFFFF